MKNQYNLFLSEKSIAFIKVAAAIEDMKPSEFIEMLIEEYRLSNDLQEDLKKRLSNEQFGKSEELNLEKEIIK